MRKFAAFILTTVTILSLVIIPTNARYFSDVNIGHWARESINYATDNGYIDPVSTYTFDPDGNFTRADVAKMIYRFEGSPAIATTTQFTDVSSTASYAKAVSWVKVNNIMGGTSNTTFEPNTGIKRQDLIVVLYRYGDYLHEAHQEYEEAKEEGITPLPKDRYIKNNVMEKRADITGVSDYSSITDYALEAVSWAVATKLITGEQGGIIAPKKIVVRETGAELLKRFGIYVEGINFDRDVYGFTNNDFTHENYFITNQHKSILYNYLEITGEIDDNYNNTGMTVQDIIEAKIAEDYGGSCFGVALTTVLNKVGKLDYTRHFGGTSAECLRDIDTLENNSSLESAINYYHFSQHVTGVKNDRISNRCWKSNSTATWKNWIDNLPSIVDANGMIMFNYGGNFDNSSNVDFWHAVIIYDYKVNVNGYTFYIYDPNCLTKRELTATYVIEAGVSTVKLQNGTHTILVGDYLKDFANIYHRYNRYDLDSYYNDFDAGTSAATATLNLIDQEYISKLFDDMTFDINGVIVNDLVPYSDTITR